MKKRHVDIPLPWEWLTWGKRDFGLVLNYYDLNIDTALMLLSGANAWYVSGYNPGDYIERVIPTRLPWEVQQILENIPLRLYLTLYRRVGYEGMDDGEKDFALEAELSRILLKSAKIMTGNYTEQEVAECDSS